MNLMVVSEQHQVLVVAVEHQLYVYQVDFVKIRNSARIQDAKPKIISLDND